ncbi:MAG: hypothetical protein K2M64_02215, partial [Clostridia bacterium]|nr:hypothetical protein [Clostridia bacterium]
VARRCVLETWIVVGKENNRMGFGVLEDKYNNIEVALYGATYEKYKTLFAADAFVVVKGSIAESRDGYKLNVRELIDPHAKNNDKTEERAKPKASQTTLWLKMEVRNDEVYARIREILDQYEGDVPVKIKIENTAYGMETTVRRCSGIEYELCEVLGEGNVKFVEK